MTKPEHIAAIRDAIAVVEEEKCHCVIYGWKCARCWHLEDLQAQLREAEGV